MNDDPDRDGDGRDALAGALDAGDWELVRSLVTEEPGRSDVADSVGVSVLLHAAYRRDQEVVAAILAARDPQDVFEAAAVGDAEVVADELDLDPALLDAISPDGFTPLHLACFLGHGELAEALVDAGADVDAVAQNPMRVRPLHSAVAAGDGTAVQALLAAGAAVDVVQQGGFTPLMGAAHAGRADLVRALLDAGAAVGPVTDDGRTAADLAADDEVRELLSGR